MLEPEGGIDHIGKAFERHVQHLIRYQAQVQEIRQTAERVRIIYQDLRTGATEMAGADYCLCTLPLTVLSQVPADVSPEMRHAINGVSYHPAVKVGLQFKRGFWTEVRADPGGVGGGSVRAAKAV